jgi:threonine synthase
VVPIGGGGTLASIWRAFRDLREMGVADQLPKLVGVQPERYNGLEIAMQRGLASADELRAIPFDDVPPTVLVKLAHTFSHDGEEALAAVRESGGTVVSVSDADAFAAQRRIGEVEGLYAEPSSTVALTAIERLREEGMIRPGDVVTGILTGSGHRETHVLASRDAFAPERITMLNGLDRIREHLATHGQFA